MDENGNELKPDNRIMEEFNFLFTHDNETNRYYRWRVYSLVQGDSLKQWRTEPFCIYQGGKTWVPPRCAFDEKRK